MMKWLFLAFGLVMYAVSAPQTAYATVPGGCVGTFETSLVNAVGWIDVGVMLGNEQATAPARFVVEAPDGAVTTYLNGDGLTPPTNVLPIWFAPADQLGDYRVIVDGEVCIATLTALAPSSEFPSPSAGPLLLATPQSESGTENPIGALTLISVGIAGLILCARRWRQA